MEYEFSGAAVLTYVPHPGAAQMRRECNIRIAPAHPDSPKEYALLLPGGTGCSLRAKAAQALLAGRSVWIRVDRVYQVALAVIEAPEGFQGATQGISHGEGRVR